MLILGPGGEFVVEILVRGEQRRAVERVLEGWCSAKDEACELNSLDSLKNIFSKRNTVKEVNHISFGWVPNTNHGI